MGNATVDSGAHIRFAWIAAIFVGFVGTMMFRNESAEFAVGTLVAGLFIGLLISPFLYLASRLFSKSKWLWYHWLNAATFSFLAIEMCKWIFLPTVFEKVNLNQTAVQSAQPNVQPVHSSAQPVQPSERPAKSVVPAIKPGSNSAQTNERWLVVHKEEAALLSFDMQTVQRNGNDMTFWMRINHANPQTDELGNTYDEYTRKVVAHCGSNRIFGGEYFYRNAGVLVRSVSLNIELPLYPDSTGEVMYSLVCNLK